MKEIYALQDAYHCGELFYKEAIARGWDAHLIQHPSQLEIEQSLFFARISQEHEQREKEIPFIQEGIKKNMVFIPDVQLLLEYEDKLKQADRYTGWMPKTTICYSKPQALNWLSTITYPFISKSRTGSASTNVRFIQTEEQALKECTQVFSREGMMVPHKLGEGIQQGYLIWQQFIPNNSYDYRACIIGNSIMLLRRNNRINVPFASGSGNIEVITELNTETKEVLDFSFKFFNNFNMKWGGIDLVKDYTTNSWKMLETTIGWKQTAYAKCAFFTQDGTNTGDSGRYIWTVFCDYLERNIL